MSLTVDTDHSSASWRNASVTTVSVQHLVLPEPVGSESNPTAWAVTALYIQIVITIFMILFGVNFNVYFLLLTRKFSQAIEI